MSAIRLASRSTASVTSDSSSTKPASGGRPSIRLRARRWGASTGAACTRSSPPAGVVVTNWAPASAPRSSCRSIVSSACRTMPRSMTPNTERPSPTGAASTPCSASRASRARAAALYRRMRPSRLQTSTLCCSSDISAARRFFSASTLAFAACDRLFDFALQLAATLRQRVHRVGGLPRLLRALGHDAILRVRCGDEVCGFCQAAHGLDGPVEPAPHDPEDPADERDEEQHQQPNAWRGQQLRQLCALGRLEVEPYDDPGGGDERDDERRNARRGEPEASARRHSPGIEILRTLAARSRERPASAGSAPHRRQEPGHLVEVLRQERLRGRLVQAALRGRRRRRATPGLAALRRRRVGAAIGQAEDL